MILLSLTTIICHSFGDHIVTVIAVPNGGCGRLGPEVGILDLWVPVRCNWLPEIKLHRFDGHLEQGPFGA